MAYVFMKKHVENKAVVNDDVEDKLGLLVQKQCIKQFQTVQK